MAIATAAKGRHKLYLSPLEGRIAASLQTWARYRRMVQKEFQDHVSCLPKQLHHRFKGFCVMEHRCTWSEFKPAIMPLCDTIEIVAPPRELAASDADSLGKVFLSVERLMVGPPIVSLFIARIGPEELEFLHLPDFADEELQALVEMATPEPTIFVPTETWN